MDRIQQQSLKSPRQPAVDSSLHVESALFSVHSRDTTVALFAPLHYEPGYAYPLIVWLHGQGGDERQLIRIMPQVSMRNYVAAAPRGMCTATAGEPDRGGYGWRQSDDHIEQAEQRVFESIDTARRKYHIAPERIFLAGFDSGGTMAFRVALNRPERFAGVLSLCGPFPHDRMPLGHLAEARQLPILLGVGRYSREYLASEVCENLRLFHTAGLSTMLRQYPCGHELSQQMLADVDRWIIEQITSTADSC
ncbi:MAG: hypothetical protein A2V70_16985 [Planctomycetes bacterium RBG_13_63_9]|nr:MAG: hypothetical protein A2V70_16985 [Planctomycetes bacterium RBG_13_63_9]